MNKKEKNSSQIDLSFHNIESFLDELDISKKNKGSRKLFRRLLIALFNRIWESDLSSLDYSEDLLVLVDQLVVNEKNTHKITSIVLIVAFIAFHFFNFSFALGTQIFKIVYLYIVFCTLDLLTYKSFKHSQIRAADLGLDQSIYVSEGLYSNFQNNQLKRTFYGRWYLDVLCILYMFVLLIINQNVYKF